MDKLIFNIDNTEVKGFYFKAKIKTEDDLVFLDDYKFRTRTMAYMLSPLNFVYVFFIYVDKDTPDYYDILHKAELELVKKVGFTKQSYSIFKPGLIIDWKNGEIKKFIDYLKSKNPDIEIKVNENDYKVFPELSSFGVLFESTLTSISCMFCDLLSCEYRRSKLDEKLIEKIYRLENSKESKS